MNFYANLPYLMRFYPKSSKLSIRKENTFPFFPYSFPLSFLQKDRRSPLKMVKGFYCIGGFYLKSGILQLNWWLWIAESSSAW
jgi:hypothetical protein